MLAALAEQGVTIIFITHKLREILAITHRVSVMRGGEVVGTVPTSETSREQLAEMMVDSRYCCRLRRMRAPPETLRCRCATCPPQTTVAALLSRTSTSRCERVKLLVWPVLPVTVKANYLRP